MASVLDRPVYSSWEAALLLGIPTQTLHRWLEGALVKGVSYAPVIRAEPTGSDVVTWGEFVEAGFLREYRHKKVPLQKMRPFINRVRAEFGVRYPLAHFKPMIDHRDLVYRLQNQVDLDPDLYLLRAENDQLVWAEAVEAFLQKVEFSPEKVVIRLRPMGQESPVTIDPRVAFGIPQIRGIRTELIADSFRAGGIHEAQNSWDLSEADVEAAVAWESSLDRAA